MIMNCLNVDLEMEAYAIPVVQEPTVISKSGVTRRALYRVDRGMFVTAN